MTPEKPRSFNCQTYVDARVIAGLARAYAELGIPANTLSAVARTTIERAYKALVTNGEVIPFHTQAEAFDWLRRNGFSVKQISDLNRKAAVRALGMESLTLTENESEDTTPLEEAIESITPEEIEKALKETEL